MYRRMKFAQLITLLICFASLESFAQRPQRSTAAGFAQIDGGRLYYEIAGAGPPLVLIHGGQLDSRMWDGQFELFAKHYQVIRYDVRGFGRSSPATKPYASEDDLYALLKSLQIQKTYLIGLSLGGRISIDFALAHPEMVAGVVAVAPGLSGFNFTPDPNDMTLLQAAQAGDMMKVADLWLKSGYMAPAMENPKLAPRLRQLALENAHENLDNPLLERLPDPPAIRRLPDIKVPTLIIVGSRDVSDIHEITGLMRARIPNAQEVVIGGAGHMVNMEKPTEFIEAVMAFLGRLQ